MVSGHLPPPRPRPFPRRPEVFQHLQAQGKWSWGQPQWPGEALFDEADVDSDAEVPEMRINTVTLARNDA